MTRRFSASSGPYRFLLLCALLVAAGCSDSGTGTAAEHYSSGPGTRGGTGRYYMGREIGTVMSHLDAGKLDRPERETQERTDVLIDLLPVRNGMRIADIGAGSGYFTLRLAKRFPDATIVAVDIQPEMLQIIQQRAMTESLDNIELVLGTAGSAGLAAQSTDLVLLVDSYHEFEQPRASMLNLRDALSPDGRIVIVEQRAEDAGNPLVQAHKMFAEQIIAEMAAVGLYPAGSSDRLPEQHFLSFSRTPITPSGGPTRQDSE